jgi:hypothetical protein
MELWLAVIHGAKGMSWWPPTIGWGKIPPRNLDEASRFLLDIGQLTDVILADPSPLTVSTNQTAPGSRVDATLRESGGDIWIIAQRVTDFGESSATDLNTQFAVSPLSGLRGHTTATVHGENRTISVVDGSFVDRFAPYSTHVYQIHRNRDELGARMEFERPASPREAH